MANFSANDHVFCPQHGAGVITAVNERDGRTYLSIEIEHAHMTLMIPEDALDERGIRKAIGPRKANEIIRMLKSDSEDLPENRQERARFVTEQCRTDDPVLLAQLIRDLHGRELDGGTLSAAETKSLEIAREHLASELGYAKSVDQADAMQLIDRAVGVPSDN